MLNRELRDILRECKNGDKKAVEEMIKAVKPLVLSTAHSLHTDINSKEDLIQEGYIIVIKTLRDYDEQKGIPYLGYLKKALKFGMYKSLKTSDAVSLNCEAGEDMELIDFIEDKRPLISERVEEKEKFRALYEAIEKLTPWQKQIIKGRFFENKTLKEISIENAKCYTASVKVQRTALKALKKEVYEYIKKIF